MKFIKKVSFFFVLILFFSSCSKSIPKNSPKPYFHIGAIFLVSGGEQFFKVTDKDSMTWYYLERPDASQLKEKKSAYSIINQKPLEVWTFEDGFFEGTIDTIKFSVNQTLNCLVEEEFGIKYFPKRSVSFFGTTFFAE